MDNIRYATLKDSDFWFSLDKHLAQDEFINKVSTKRAYILEVDNTPIGLLRYNLFWDNIPFCTLLYIDPNHQREGFGKSLMLHWEKEMKKKGYNLLMTSTQVDENAQHFYRYLEFQDAGGLVFNSLNHQQPMELFLTKVI